MTRTPPPSTRRGQDRHERLLNAAAELVARRGFHAVGVSEIGAAAGVSGAALYRHFDNKTAMLVALFDRAIDRLLENATEAISDVVPPGDTLSVLVAGHVEFALKDRSLLAVYHQEAHNLPGVDRKRLRRKQHHYVEIWRNVLRATHPSMPDELALARVEAVFGLLNSAPNLSPQLRDQTLRDDLARMATAALTAPAG
jgi:AcrR family transcriptional regulator